MKVKSKTRWLLGLIAAAALSGIFFAMPVFAAEGDQITGLLTPNELESFLGVSHLDDIDVATIRYCYTNTAGEETYGLADFNGDIQNGFNYSFSAPTDSFSVIEGAALTNRDAAANATVIASCYTTDVWDGAVDVSWYDEDSDTFILETPAQLAGFAAIVNGGTDINCDGYEIKGERVIDVTDAEAIENDDIEGTAGNYYNDGESLVYYKHFVKPIQAWYESDGSLTAQGHGPVHIGVRGHDFADRTIRLAEDMDMGSGAVNHQKNYNESDIYGSHNAYEYPNWTPVGGLFLCDLDDTNSAEYGIFNGIFDGAGHRVENLYCHRWSYAKPGITAYAYTSGTGFFGSIGGYYMNWDSEAKTGFFNGEAKAFDSQEKYEEYVSSFAEEIERTPTVCNLSLSGYVFGRRSVGGIIGCISSGSSGGDYSVPVKRANIENCANYAQVYATDSKGVGGIIGTVWSAGSIINCYNTGKIMSQEYKAPAGGIIGENCGADIVCCYNRGPVSSDGNNRGRGIGADNSGRDYIVSDCYFLNGMYECSDEEFQGYYYRDAGKTVKVSVTKMTSAQMTGGELLEALNINGVAYTAGDDGYPVLAWEKRSPENRNVAIDPVEHADITADPADAVLPDGTIVRLSCETDQGWNCRYYTLNGKRVTADYITVGTDSIVSAVIEASVPGVINISGHPHCSVTVVKDGMIVNEDKTTSTVNDYPVVSGDPIYENDVLKISVMIRDGAEPDNKDYDYQGAFGTDLFPNPYRYIWTYTDEDSEKTMNASFTVDDRINRDQAVLDLTVEPQTTKKQWINLADISWYDAAQSTFTIRTARELAGLDKLVTSGTDFSGKTVKLGNDIDLTNDDGSGGKRFWNGIGNGSKAFAGTFDGQGYSVRNIHSTESGLFSNCKGTASKRAVIQNVSVTGDGAGDKPCGICSTGEYVTIRNCNNYRILSTSTVAGDYIGGILSQDKKGCMITDCFNYGDISVSGESPNRVGGIVGDLSATGSVSRSVNAAPVVSKTVTKAGYIGGVAGAGKGKFSCCANYGDLNAGSGSIGGILGAAQGNETSGYADLIDCYNVGKISYAGQANPKDYVGGIAGNGQSFKLRYCYNYGIIEKISGAMTDYFGGVFGSVEKKSYNTTTEVWFVTDSSIYAANSKSVAEIRQPGSDGQIPSYYRGINVANAAAFADQNQIMAKINFDEDGPAQIFAISNNRYPEFRFITGMHKHSGGTASCSKRAICEICDLPYGDYDETNHTGDAVETGRIEPQWMTDGTMGDVVCTDCGKVLVKGEVIPADTKKQAVRISYVSDGETFKTIDYSVEELDKLKSVQPIVWEYGLGFTNLFLTTEHVPVANLLSDRGYNMSDLISVRVVSTGADTTYPVSELTTCSRYYYYNKNGQYDPDGELNGRYKDAPAGLAIYYSQGEESEYDLAKTLTASSGLAFGFGISKEQYDAGNVGGIRIARPVTELVLSVASKKTKVTFDSDGGSSVAAQHPDIGGSVERPTDPIRAGYTFSGWYLGDQLFDFNTAVTDDLVLKAVWKKNAEESLPIYRLYNKKTKEHLWTANKKEYTTLPKYGWTQEGTAWNAPKSGKAVYRLYNKKSGDHHYTANANEAKTLTSKFGWTYDNNKKPVFYSGGSTPIYRLYNKTYKVGSHHLTKSKKEYDVLPGYGWKQEGIALYCVK